MHAFLGEAPLDVNSAAFHFNFGTHARLRRPISAA
jgi:hypothetical protein